MNDLTLDLYGPVTVRRDGRVLPVAGELSTAILARLALSAGSIVDTDELIADVWAEPGPGALSSLRAYLSRLRSAGFEGLLLGSRQGYLLDAAPDRVDVLRVRSGAAALPTAGADAVPLAHALVEASAAVPFAGLETPPFVAVQRERLAEERRMLLERYAELTLEAGDPGRAVLAMSEAVERFPFDERSNRLLAVALAASGRVSDALASLDGLAARLREDRGLDLSARLIELRQAIVRSDPAVLAGGRRARTAVRNGLPHPVTRFVGRERELDAVASARAAGARLVTITGPGGAGKTRVAIEAARRADDEEQWFVELAGVRDPDAVLPAIAESVGALAADIDHIVPRLAGRRTLLVLDNAEQVVGAVAAVIAGIGLSCPDARVLVTSREPLRLPEEVLVPVGELHAGDARTVFAERAADARGGLGGDEDEELVEEVCDLLDRLPLALELAAARLDVLSLVEIRDAVLSGREDARGSGEDRHDSLANAVSWSIDLLTAPQRDLLAQLARFAGPVPEDAVIGVCRSVDERPEELLERLVDKSLVSVSTGDAGDRRYRLLDVVRRHLAGVEPEEAESTWFHRHRLWFTDYALRQGPRTRTFDAKAANGALDLVRADLRLAFDAAERDGDRECALELAGSQAHHWFTRGLLAEGVRTLERALAVPGEARPEAEAHALLGLTLLAYQSGDAERAFAAIARAFEIASAAGDANVTAVALARNAYGLALFGDPVQSRSLLASAQTLSDGAEPWARAEVLTLGGQTLRALGEPEAALARLDEGYAVAAASGYTWMMSTASYIAGKILVESRRGSEAIDELAEGAARAWNAEDPASVLAQLHALAGACALVERHEEGARILGAVDRIGVRYGYNPVTAEGEEASRLRDRVRQGLTDGDFDRAYASGAALEIADLLLLTERLPRRARTDRDPVGTVGPPAATR